MLLLLKATSAPVSTLTDANVHPNIGETGYLPQHWVKLKRLRRQMSQQQQRSNNSDSINRFHEHQPGMIVKLPRSKWPVPESINDDEKLDESHQQDKNKNVTTSVIQEKINMEGQLGRSKTKNHQDHSSSPFITQEIKPLIHTDKVNTSSPILYVYGPKSSRSGRMHSMNDYLTAESSISPNRVAILSGTGVSTAPKMSNLQTKSSTSTTPHLVVLDLQVSSSTVGLTWSLSFQRDAVTSETEELPAAPILLEVAKHNSTSTAIPPALVTTNTPTHLLQQKLLSNKELATDKVEVVEEEEEEKAKGSRKVKKKRESERKVDIEGLRTRTKRATSIRVDSSLSRASNHPIALISQEANQQAIHNKRFTKENGYTNTDDDLKVDQHNDSVILAEALNVADPKRISTLDTLTSTASSEDKKVSNNIKRLAESASNSTKSSEITNSSLTSDKSIIASEEDRLKSSPLKLAAASANFATETRRSSSSSGVGLRGEQVTETSPLNPKIPKGGIDNPFSSNRRHRLDSNGPSSGSTEAPLIRAPAVTINRIIPSIMRHHYHKSNRGGKSLSNDTQVEGVASETNKVNSKVSSTEYEASSGNRSVSSALNSSSQSKRSFAGDEEPIKWLIRLRRFGSNEVDVVQVVLSTKLLETFDKQKQAPYSRNVVFKGLEPAAGYELCVESPNLKQQVDDRYQILDSNHYLGCHLNLGINSTAEDSPELTKTTLHSSDLESRIHHQQVSEDENFSHIHKTHSVERFCKEFFTLAQNTSESVTIGGITNGKKLPRSQISDAGELVANQTSSSSIPLSRRPKSLSGTLKSRIEMLEISDLSSNSPGSKGISNFEMMISTPYRNLIQGSQQVASISARTLQESSSLLPTISGPIRPPNRILLPDQQSGLPNFIPSQSSGSQDFQLTLSLLPIVGCVFAIIFMITLANILLSAINCGSSNSRVTARSTRSRTGPGRTGASNMTNSAFTRQQQQQQQKLKHLVGSGFYSDHSDMSNTSQSRMVIGNEGLAEPFANSAAFFDLPANSSGRTSSLTSHRNPDNLKRPGSSSPYGVASNYLLTANATRFPLGPSFEGDEKHNADMVGLARKNYDNFINSIYNSDTQSPDFVSNNSASHSSEHYNSNDSETIGHHHHRQQKQFSRTGANKKFLTNKRARISSGQQVEEQQPTSGRASENSMRSPHQQQRLRFDKINPIYNMDGLLYNSSSAGTPRTRLLSPLASVTSFGYSNQALSLNERENEQGNLTHQENTGEERNISGASEADCPLCNSQVVSSNLDEVENSPPPPPPLLEDEEVVPEDSLENEEDERYPYACCLDRQQQRFERQQEQLERVLTRNGSLLPQPFIHPTGSLRCGSPNCQAALKEHGAIKLPDEDGSLGSQLDKGELEFELMQGSKCPSTNIRNQHSPASSTVPDKAAPNNQNSSEFRDTSSSSSIHLLPATPPTTIALKPLSPSNLTANSKSLQANTDEAATMNKTDFNQRRIELASKLHLNGMVKNY